MPTILGITLPIFLLMAAGFLSTRGGLLLPQETRGLGTFVINFALPALLFNAMAERSIASLVDVGLLAAYALGSLAIAAFTIAAACALVPLGDAAMRCALVLNAGMPMVTIYPILGRAYGEEGMGAAALVAATAVSFITVNLLLWLTRMG